MNIKETLYEIICDCCEDIDPDSITDTSSFLDDLEMSSLEVFNLTTELEDEFDIKITDRELQEFITVADAVRILTDKVEGR